MENKDTKERNRSSMKKQYWLYLIIFITIVLLPPLLHGSELLVINNDTAVHLASFESIKDGDPQFLYPGQKVVGYSLVWIESITSINLPTLFMWFNFLVILFGGLAIATLVIVTTKSWLGGMLSAWLIVFGIGSTQHLFWSGTIFNLIEHLILLPLMLIALYYVSKKNTIKFALPALIITGTGIFLFHPSFISGIKYLFKDLTVTEAVINPITGLLLFFGIVNVLLLIPCWLGIKSKKGKIELPTKIAFGILLATSSGMLLAAEFNLTPFSSRLIINAFLLFGIALCIYVGVAMKSNNKLIKGSVIALVTIGTIPSLTTWFTQTSLYNPDRGLF